MIRMKTVLGLGRLSNGRRFRLVTKAAEVNAFSVYSYGGNPKTAIFAPMHTNNSRLVIDAKAGVFVVSGLIRMSQIANSIVRRITIYMVNAASRPRPMINGIGNPVRQVSFAKHSSLQISILVRRNESALSSKHLVPPLSASPSFVVGAVGSEYPYRPRLPSQFTSLVIVMEQTAQKFGRGLFCHAKH